MCYALFEFRSVQKVLIVKHVQKTNKYKTTTKTTILDLVTPKMSIFDNFTAKISHTYYCDPKSNITNYVLPNKK